MTAQSAKQAILRPWESAWALAHPDNTGNSHGDRAAGAAGAMAESASPNLLQLRAFVVRILSENQHGLGIPPLDRSTVPWVGSAEPKADGHSSSSSGTGNDQYLKKATGIRSSGS